MMSHETLYQTAEVITILTLNEKWMITAFPQFHHGIHQVWQIGARLGSFIQEVEVPFQDSTVILLLDISQFNLKVNTRDMKSYCHL